MTIDSTLVPGSLSMWLAWISLPVTGFWERLHYHAQWNDVVFGLANIIVISFNYYELFDFSSISLTLCFLVFRWINNKLISNWKQYYLCFSFLSSVLFFSIKTVASLEKENLHRFIVFSLSFWRKNIHFKHEKDLIWRGSIRTQISLAVSRSILLFYSYKNNCSFCYFNHSGVIWNDYLRVFANGQEDWINTRSSHTKTQ